MRSDLLLRLTKMAILATVYVVAAKFGLMMDAVSGFATLVWPATGLALAALLIIGHDMWPGIALGAFVVNVWAGASVPVALGIAVGNTLEAIVGTYLLRQRFGFRSSFDSIRHVMGLISAAMLSPILSATVGVLTLRLGGVVPALRFAETWRAWWVGDTLGDLVVGSLLLSWAGMRRQRVRPRESSKGLA